MDARSFQQHAARVAELTDALLAERADPKPSLEPQADRLNSPAPEDPPCSDVPCDLPPSRASGPPSPSQTPEAAGHVLRNHSAVHSARAASDERNSVHPGRVPHAQQQDDTAQTSHTSAGKSYTTLPDSGLTQGALLSASASAAPGRPSPALPAAGPGSLGSSGGGRGPHYCTMCKVSTTSAVHLQTHYMGSKHQRRLAQTHNGTDSGVHGPHHCSVCGISATSAVHLQLHLTGRAHHRKLKLAAEPGSDSQGTRPSPASLVPNTQTGTAR